MSNERKPIFSLVTCQQWKTTMKNLYFLFVSVKKLCPIVYKPKYDTCNFYKLYN